MTTEDQLGGDRVVAALRDLTADLPPAAAERAAAVETELRAFLTSVQLSVAHYEQTRSAVEEHLRDVAEFEHDAAGDLRAEAQARTAFLVALSHDLRAPIGALVHQAQLLGSDDLSDDIRRRSVETLRHNAGLLSRMMDDLVDIERFAMGELRLQQRPIPLATLLDVIDVGDVEVVIEDGDARAWVDVDAMTRAMRTLVGVKARRYPTSQVLVVARAEDGHVEITVRAESESAPPSEAPDASRAIDLRLIGALVEAHDGSMSSIDHGVVVRLPRFND